MKRLLAINPGSTSTKLAVYDDEKCIVETTVRHQREELEQFEGVLDQIQMRRDHVLKMLEESSIGLDSLDAIVGRGGLVKPIDSGTYVLNQELLDDLRSDSAASHASALGGILAYELGAKSGIPAYVVDPVVVDEMEPCAKLTGIPGIERRSAFHALNTKAIARRAAKKLGIEYESGRFVVAHMGGGITVGAHRYGRVIDVNDAMAGEGPFTPERSGAVPLLPLIDMCFSGKHSREEMVKCVVGSGGMSAYLGTNDLRAVENMIKTGDEYAALVMDSMAYQVTKDIGAMAAVLEGRVSAIVLTGGLAYSNRFTGAIKQRVDQIAQVLVFPGEDEMLALIQGVLRVMNGEEKPKVYGSM